LRRLGSTIDIRKVDVRLGFRGGNFDSRLNENEPALIALAFLLLPQELLLSRFELLLARQEPRDPRHELQRDKDEDVQKERRNDDVASRKPPADDLLVLIPFLEVEMDQR
jgi:hypothetical protein